MKSGGQATLRRAVHLSGIGVHSGSPVSLIIHPAEAGTGIVFIRTALGEPDREVRATPNAVAATEFATILGDARGAAVATIEHVMAALYGLGIDNAAIELDGPEVPILDGSAGPFVEAIDAAGLAVLPAPRRYLRVLKPIGVTCGAAYGELRPHDGFRIEIDIAFDHPLIGRQAFAQDVDAQVFRRELARARTFGFTRDVARLWKAGYALGASLENTVVVGDNDILNPEGLRFPDEFVRHKALDAIGDLALAGAPLLGAYRSIRGGHRLNYAVLSALMADASAWTWVEEREPVRAARGRAALSPALQPAFAPDVS
ncbi:MAG TPA: UDP-3-O-acyl-N-acetylglucosamine deacetylase [Xanthobacteraceae bacterium]|nr:UDP-3-O-acyl-N-acetylglucosamine deacetylase [Xanthobacteraceae bacterium]